MPSPSLCPTGLRNRETASGRAVCSRLKPGLTCMPSSFLAWHIDGLSRGLAIGHGQGHNHTGFCIPHAVSLPPGGLRVSAVELLSNAGVCEVCTQPDGDPEPSYLATVRSVPKPLQTPTGCSSLHCVPTGRKCTTTCTPAPLILGGRKRTQATCKTLCVMCRCCDQRYRFTSMHLGVGALPDPWSRPHTSKHLLPCMQVNPSASLQAIRLRLLSLRGDKSRLHLAFIALCVDTSSPAPSQSAPVRCSSFPSPSGSLDIERRRHPSVASGKAD